MKSILAGLQQNPQRADLVAGFIALCRTVQNPQEQADSLIQCSKTILASQPLVALRILELALAIAPRHLTALDFAREIFKRRGRWSSEQRVAELMATLTQATATTILPKELSSTLTAASDKPSEESEKSIIDEQRFGVERTAPEQQPLIEDFIPVREPAAAPVSASVVESDPDVEPRVAEFLKRCGFEQSWASYATGVSKTNAGLVAFVSMLVSLGFIKANDLTLAGIMLQKMLNEKPDDSGAQNLLEKLFPDLVSGARGGK